MDPHTTGHFDPGWLAGASALATSLNTPNESENHDTAVQPPSRWNFSVEQIVIFVTLLGGIVASYTSLSAKVDALTTTLFAISARATVMEDRVRLHELLPSHPVSDAELRHLKDRLDTIDPMHHAEKKP